VIRRKSALVDLDVDEAAVERPTDKRDVHLVDHTLIVRDAAAGRRACAG
jgi:hypothetical protein